MPKKRDHGQGALYQLKGRKLWRGVIDVGFKPDGSRDQRSVHARTQRECAAKLEQLKAEIAEFGAPLDKQTTVAKWVTHWLNTVAKVTVDPSTYSTYASVTKRWIIPTIGKKTLAALKPSDIRAVRTAITDAGRGTSLVRQAHAVLSGSLDAAKADRLVRSNVAEDVAPPKRGPARQVSIATDEALRILQVAAALPDSAGSRWWFKLLVGARQTEIVGATLADLDLERGYYVIQWKLEELVREHGCMGKPDDPPVCGYKRGANCPQARWRIPDGFEGRQLVGRLWLTRPKATDDARVVPLIPQLAEAIRRHVEDTRDWPNPHGLIWRHPDGSPIVPKEDGQQWKDLLVAAGVITREQAVPKGTPLTGHVARHTTVTILASLGVDLQVIGEIVGHADVDMTKLYRHVMEKEKRAAMEALGTAWGEGLALPSGNPGIGQEPQVPAEDEAHSPFDLSGIDDDHLQVGDDDDARHG